MVNQYVSGKRGPGSFPAPVCDLTDGYPLWQWYEVACWLWQKGIVGEAVLRASQDIAVINRVLKLIHLRKLDPSLAEEVFRVIGETQSAASA